ncbi:MAG: bifunctional alpha,alpha-trehalose-phosphate synthase (UDP-forming)/trehalose-phosphatase [Planctomycetota bacterium]|jgi:trehalose 6-phosphate synthase/phosphatase
MAPTTPPQGRLFLVSNRLPISLEERADGLQVKMSAGGLATGLAGLHRESGGAWIGWPGTTTEDGSLTAEMQEALAEQDLVGVGLTEEEHRGYYQNLSNQCIWPLFHYFHERMHYAEQDWEQYVAINRRFADVVLEQVGDHDTVFVQDFHLMLLPRMLREARPDLRIGFFLHIPFPSSEVFRIFPKREELLHGVLGADLIAFHTLGYVRHFRSAVAHVLGIETQTTRFLTEGREVKLLAQPLAIDAEQWEAGDGDQEHEIAEYAEYLEGMSAGRRIILGVERLDYTKGIPERMEAFREFLSDDPSRVDQVMMIQVAVPSRADVPDYQELKDEVDRLAGSINSEFGRPGLQPLHYLYQSVPPAQLRALYRTADVALVTPLRDGLNLVAKEFVASRHEDDGVLVLGESTGASWELGEALRINTYDTSALKRGIVEALGMPLEDQRARMKPMRARVGSLDVEGWARNCLDAIRSSHRSSPAPTHLDPPQKEELLSAWREGLSHGNTLFLDYDGTLREFTASPNGARPTPEILKTLRDLAEHPRLHPWVVSGRSADLLDRWVGETGVGLVAEHGAFLRPPGESAFLPLFDASRLPWKDEARVILEEFTARVPGSRIEEKAVGIAWHYREADTILGAWQAKELFQHLAEMFMDQGVQVMRGARVLEVRPAGVSKGQALRRILAEGSASNGLVLAAGDDHTDESMFRELDQRHWSILIGNRPSAARFRLDSPAACRQLLQELALSSGRPLNADN